MKTVLTIAGSDTIGGAGIQADIKTLTINGVYAMSVITSLTAQNTTSITQVQDVSPDFLEMQLKAVFDDIVPDAIKIGMVSSSELINVIADFLKRHNAKNIVIDPVMVSSSKKTLLKENAIGALTNNLIPLATVITPNIPEMELFSNSKIDNEDDMQRISKDLVQKFNTSILAKGGHSNSDCNDLLVTTDGLCKWFLHKRISNPNTHGTGCTLSSAIAANLAKDVTLEKSVENAKKYISNILKSNLDLGKGSGPLDHAYGYLYNN